MRPTFCPNCLRDVRDDAPAQDCATCGYEWTVEDYEPAWDDDDRAWPIAEMN